MAFPEYSMAFPDSTWARGGYIRRLEISPKIQRNTEEVKVQWYIESFLDGCKRERNPMRKELRSNNFEFADASWNLFCSFDLKKAYSLFGINIRRHNSSDMVLKCISDIYFHDMYSDSVKYVHCNFECGDAYSSGIVDNFFSQSELASFLKRGYFINCTIKVLKSSIIGACPPAEISHSISSSAVEVHTQTELFEDQVCEVCQDLKNLLLSEEGSDITIQVRYEQFKAHRSILTARSSVFAATFRHDMKEKATGVVDVEYCDPSSFPVLLEFLYCGNTEKLSVENVFGLYTSADKYNMQSFKLKCLEFIKSNLSVDTFCETVTLSLQHSEANLLKLSVEFFAKNFKEIIVTTKWQAFIVENPIQGNEIFNQSLSI